MSEKKNKSYTAEFKESAVKLAVQSDQSVSVTAKELGVNVNTLHTWIAKYHRPKATNVASKGEEHVYDELRRLRKEVSQLKEERAILKKAATFFAKECH